MEVLPFELWSLQGLFPVPPLFLHPPLSSSLGLLDTFVMQKQRLQTSQSYSCTCLGSGRTGAPRTKVDCLPCFFVHVGHLELFHSTLLCDDSLLRRDFGLFEEAVWEGIL